jgi:hypothetical protein
MKYQKEYPPERTEQEISENKYYVFDDETMEWSLEQGASREDDERYGIV